MKRYLSKIIFLMISLTTAYGHPHTFFELYPTVDIKDNKLEKLSIKWVMDEMTSSLLVMEFDINGNGKIDEDENKFIYEEYFLSLQSYDFYVHIKKNKKKLVIPNPKNFKASINKNRIIYDFDLEKKYLLKNLKIDFFDDDLFVGFILKKNFITIKGIEKGINNKIKKNLFGVE